MKKNLFYCIFFCAFIYNVKIDAQNVQFGVRLGTNASWIGKTPDKASADGLNIGFTGGAWVRLAFRDADESGFYIQPELLFSTFGSKYVSNLSSSFGKTENKTLTTFRNFEVPVLAGYRMMLGETSELRLYAGPVFARVNNAKQVETTTISTDANAATNTPATSVSKEITNDITDKMKGSYTAGLLGVGFNIKKFTIDVRFQKVLTNMYQNSTNTDDRPAMFQIGVGYRIF